MAAWRIFTRHIAHTDAFLVSISCALAACSPPAPTPTSPQHALAHADAGAARNDAAPVREAAPEPQSEKAIEVEIDRARLKKDVAFVAKPRPPKSAHWKRVQTWGEKRLQELKLDSERQSYGTGTNIVARRPGSTREGEQVIVSAHYDHVARCAGADDNASGVAAVLEIARVLEPFRFSRTLVIALWDEEERGLLGSRAYAKRARENGDKIAVAFSLDAIGFASHEPGSQRVPEGFEKVFVEQGAALKARGYAGDFVALLANTDASHAAASFRRHADAIGLPVLSAELSLLEAFAFPDVFRSDHASFWQNGYPALLLSDSGEFRNPGYHCGKRADSPATLDYEFLERVTAATALAAADLLEVE